MIRKSGDRFSEKIMLKPKRSPAARAAIQDLTAAATFLMSASSERLLGNQRY
jgi:hypothetical protein